MSVISARDFNRDVSAAKRAADKAPVTVTDRGEPAYVLLSIADYRKLTVQSSDDFLDALSMDDEVELELDRFDFAPRVPEL